jgi:CelD/BcsL family acetyltransferase involved in cellulose biosynthesis
VNRVGDIGIREISDLDSLRVLAPEWDTLFQRCSNATTFQRPEWLLTWAEVFQPTQMWVLEARKDSRLLGLAPLFVNRWAPEPALGILGAYTSDYLDWLIDPDFATEIIPALLEYIGGDALASAGLELTNLPSNSSLLRPEFWKQWQLEVTADDTCPILRLLGKKVAIEALISPAQFRNLRKARRRAEKVGRIQIEVATHLTLDEMLTGLLTLHQARWAQRRLPGLLADEDVQSFHRRAATALLQRGVLRLYGLRLDGALIAVIYTLAEREVVYCYLQGFDPDYAELSPGVQILGAVIEDAIREGKRAVDFLRGREAYKYAWGATDEPSFRLRARKAIHLESLAIQDPTAA